MSIDEEIERRDPLVRFSWYLSGRAHLLQDLSVEIASELDRAFEQDCVKMDHVLRAEGLMWLWIMGAYEVIRTMAQAKKCFSVQLTQRLDTLKQELADVRMPAAKMEKRGQRAPVASSRSPCGFDVQTKDILVGDPTATLVSARRLLSRYQDTMASIKLDDIVARHEDSY